MQKLFNKKTFMGSLFVIGLACLLTVASVLLPDNYENVVGKLLINPAEEPDNTMDVLILGDSEAYSSIIPTEIWQQYGITTCCCSTPAQVLCYSEQLLMKTFQNQSPKIVFLETNAIFRHIPFDRSFFTDLESNLSVSSAFYRWKSIHEVSLGITDEDDPTKKTKGYTFSLDVAEADDEDYMDETSKHETIHKRNRAHVARMKKFCDQKGVKFILYSTPSTVNWNRTRHNAVQALADEMGVEYIDMNILQKEIPIDWANDSRDNGDHLNYHGALKVTDYLGKYLNETGLFVSHKSDGNYASWDEAADALDEIVKTELEADK